MMFMKAKVYDMKGKLTGDIELPRVFSTRVRDDLILRAFLSTMSRKRQDHGTDPMAGQRSSAHYHGRRRRVRWTMMGKEMARMSRLHGKIPGYLMYKARIVPQSVKGRVAHPPKVEKEWEQNINKKERQLAIRSAISATKEKGLVESRGHKVKDITSLPIVVEDGLQKVSKTSELEKFLEVIGLKDELDRIVERKVRSGKGPSRGNKYRNKVGPLIVVSDDEGVGKAAKNIPGVDISRVENLSVEYLAPGASAGRLTIFTKGAIEKLGA